MINKPHTFTVNGLIDRPNGKREYGERIPANPNQRRGNIQQSTDTVVNAEGKTLENVYDLYVDIGSDIELSDDITDNLGRNFRVQGVDVHDQGRSYNNYNKFVLSLE